MTEGPLQENPDDAHFAEDRSKVVDAEAQRRRLLARALESNRNRSASTTRQLDGPNDPAPIPRVARDQVLYASFAQKQMWVADQMEPEHPVYNLASRHRLRGPLDIRALEAALTEIVRRHESLRTGIEWNGKDAVQNIHPAVPVELTITDLSQLDETSALNEASKRSMDRIYEPFDLSGKLMIRGYLYVLGKNDHVLVLNLHHIASDGWSQSILWRELTELYSSFLHARRSPLSEPAIQYADFAEWQRKQLEGIRSEQLLDYWRKQVDDLPALRLPADRPHSGRISYQGETLPVRIAPDIASEIGAFARREGATLFMVTLAAFEVLLYRLSGQEKFAVGTAVAGRNHMDLEPMVGCFINTLPLRADLERNPTFRELLQKVRDTSLDAYDHDQLPFESLVSSERSKRETEDSPIFQVAFILHNMPAIKSQLEGVDCDELERLTRFSRLHLSVVLEQGEGTLSGSVEFSTDLFSADTVRRWMQHYETLLREAIARPDQPIARLPLMTATERQRMLVDWNASNLDLPRDRCLHELFQAHTKRAPEATAVVHETRTVSYGELAENARRLARRLQVLGAGPDVLVGLFADRSIEMVSGIFGILYAGAAYVPLDPESPQGRIDFMLEDSQAPIIVVRRHLASRLNSYNGQIVVIEDVLEQPAEAPGAESTETTPPAVHPGNLVYMIYTSGSTGKPKGVLIEHQAFANFVLGMIETYSIGPGDRLLQFASIGFDASCEDIFVHLCSGSTLVLRTDAMISDSQTFLAACEKNHITALDLPTAYWHELSRDMAAAKLALPESIRLVVIGGERARRDCLAAWQQCAGPNTRFINMYGPTETTIAATSIDLTEFDTKNENRELPIGRPMPNTQVYVLDPQGELLPVGVPGELCVGGAQVARGYHRRPDLTAEKFIPDPFSSNPAAKLYRTGDKARFRSDGVLEFVGRIDGQLKIRGYRIEPGEIETSLALHPRVKQAVVVASEDRLGSNILIAYFVPTGSPNPSPAELREFLKRGLPDYMVPAVFIAIDRVPLKPGGKIDYAQLPEPTLPVSTGGFVAPTTATEEYVAEMWKDLLRIPQVGTNDNFFELGGHSLLAMQLVSRLRQALGVTISIRELFSAPTVEKLSAAIDSALLALDSDAANDATGENMEEDVI